MNAGAASRIPIGKAATMATSMATPSLLDPAAAGNAVAQHDVEREQRAIGESEGVTERGALDMNLGQDENSSDRHDQREQIA